MHIIEILYPLLLYKPHIFTCILYENMCALNSAHVTWKDFINKVAYSQELLILS